MTKTILVVIAGHGVVSMARGGTLPKGKLPYVLKDCGVELGTVTDQGALTEALKKHSVADIEEIESIYLVLPDAHAISGSVDHLKEEKPLSWELYAELIPVQRARSLMQVHIDSLGPDQRRSSFCAYDKVNVEQYTEAFRQSGLEPVLTVPACPIQLIGYALRKEAGKGVVGVVYETKQSTTLALVDANGLTYHLSEWNGWSSSEDLAQVYARAVERVEEERGIKVDTIHALTKTDLQKTLLKWRETLNIVSAHSKYLPDHVYKDIMDPVSLYQLLDQQMRGGFVSHYTKNTMAIGGQEEKKSHSFFKHFLHGDKDKHSDEDKKTSGES